MQKSVEFEQKLDILCTLKKDFDFSTISTIKIGPKCKYYALVHTTSNLIKILKLCRRFGVEFKIVGCASNILFCGDYFDGVVLRIGMHKTIHKGLNVCCYAGQKLSNLLGFLARRNLSGLEWAVCIPASVGGAVCMNAGAFGGQISNNLVSVYALNLNTFEVEKFGILEYLPQNHKSIFTNNKNYVIIKAEFCFTKKTRAGIVFDMQQTIKKRMALQNVGLPNLGSVFCRGQTPFAPAYYIEQCGLKGVCVGDAQVSLVHSGFVVNKNHATSFDVLKLIAFVKKQVFKKFRVKLECEIQVFGG